MAIMLPSFDIGFVFALRQESVGIVDRLKHSRKTRGNGWTFHTGNTSGLSIALVLSGVGQKNAEEATKILIDVFAPKLICSAGYAGGLSSRLKQLTLCVPEQVIRESDGQALDLTNPIPRKTSPVLDRLTLLTVNDVVESPEQKRAIRNRTRAEIVDMETFAVAEICRIREIPFFSFRVVFDAANDPIPKDIAKILESMEGGTSRLSWSRLSGAVLGSVWSRPSIVLDFVSLKRRAFTASERLAQFALAELSRRKTSADSPVLLERDVDGGL